MTTHKRVEPGSELGKMVALRYYMEGVDEIAPEGGRPCNIAELQDFSKVITPEEKAEFAGHAAEALGVTLAA